MSIPERKKENWNRWVRSRMYQLHIFSDHNPKLSNRDLKAQISKGHKQATSRFESNEIYENSIKKMFDSDAVLSYIEKWMDEDNNRTIITFKMPFCVGTGYSCLRAHDWSKGPLKTNKMCVILEKTDRSPTGFDLVTAFPKIEVTE